MRARLARLRLTSIDARQTSRDDGFVYDVFKKGFGPTRNQQSQKRKRPPLEREPFRREGRKPRPDNLMQKRR